MCNVIVMERRINVMGAKREVATLLSWELQRRFRLMRTRHKTFISNSKLFDRKKMQVYPQR